MPDKQNLISRALKVGDADMSDVDLEKLDGITNGTAAASKALVTDINVDIAGIRNLTTTGKVGIGTASPQGLAHVGPAIDNPPTYRGRLIIASSASNEATSGPEDEGGIELVQLDLNAGYGAKLYTSSASDLFGIATRHNSATWTSRFVIESDTGNVGIGTTAPKTPLNVKGTISSEHGGLTNPASSGTKSGLNIGFDSFAEMGWIQSVRDNTSETRPLQLQPLGGNVGIGTTAPGKTLDVNGDIRSTQMFVSDGYGYNCADWQLGGVTSNRFYIYNNILGIDNIRIVPSTGITTFYRGVNILNGDVGIGTTAPNTALHVVGGVSKSIVTKTTTYQATISDHTIVGNHATTAFTVTLPTAASAFSGSEGLILYFVNKNVAVMTIDGSGAQTISGAATQALSQWETLTVQSDGTEWFVL